MSTTLLIEVVGPYGGRCMQVDASAFIGTCVAALVEQWHYPRMDAAGQALTYELCLLPDGRPLPNMARFRDAQVPASFRCFLQARGAMDVRMSVQKPDEATLARQASSAVPRLQHWDRRSIVWWLGGLAVALAGLGTGMTTALAQRTLLAHTRGAAAGSPGSPPPATVTNQDWHGATVWLTFAGHHQTVRHVSWSPDGKLLASGGDDAQVLVWSPDGVVQQRIPHGAAVQSLAWSPEGQRLATAAGSQVVFWHALTGTSLSQGISGHTATVLSVAWTPANQLQVVSGGLDAHAVVWDTTQYQPRAVFARHDTPIEAVSWAADGQTVASSSQGGAVRVWSAATTQEVHGFYQDAQTAMRTCAFAPAGPMLAVGGNDGLLRLWNGLFCQQQTTINEAGVVQAQCQDEPQRLVASKQALRSLAWSPDGHLLAVGSDDGSFALWSLAQADHPLFSVRGQPNIAVHSLAWSPDGKQFATASGNSVMLWNLI